MTLDSRLARLEAEMETFRDKLADPRGPAHERAIRKRLAHLGDEKRKVERHLDRRDGK